jgi:hypothetical protein
MVVAMMVGIEMDGNEEIRDWAEWRWEGTHLQDTSCDLVVGLLPERHWYGLMH